MTITLPPNSDLVLGSYICIVPALFFIESMHLVIWKISLIACAMLAIQSASFLMPASRKHLPFQVAFHSVWLSSTGFVFLLHVFVVLMAGELQEYWQFMGTAIVIGLLCMEHLALTILYFYRVPEDARKIHRRRKAVLTCTGLRAQVLHRLRDE